MLMQADSFRCFWAGLLDYNLRLFLLSTTGFKLDKCLSYCPTRLAQLMDQQ